MDSTASKYDSIAEHYTIANRFGTLEKSHACAIEQIKKEKLVEHRSQYKVLDLGVGDGAFLKQIKTRNNFFFLEEAMVKK